MRLSLESGYGSQSCSLEDCDILHEVVATSEIDADAIIAYASIRFSKEDLTKKPVDVSDEEIAKWLINKNIGYDFKQSKSKVHAWLKKKDKTYLYTIYNSAIMSNGLGDISLINEENIPNHDLLTMSSPCQDFSVAGKQEGSSWRCLNCEKEFNPIESNFLEECPHCKSTNIKKTRSSLLFECAKIIRSKTPKYILLENVKNLVGKQHIATFSKWCKWLEDQGYTNTYKVINAKDYEVPQNRERVFMISILGDDKFEFPSAPCTPVKLKDVLQDEVDEKYYINKPFTFIDKQGNSSTCNQVANLDIKGNEAIRRVYGQDKCSPTLSTMQGGLREPKVLLQYREPSADTGIQKIGNIYSSNGENGNIYMDNGTSPTLNSEQEAVGNGIGSNNTPKALEENQIIHIANTNDKFESNARVYSERGLSPTLAVGDYKDAKKIMVENSPRLIVKEATKKGYAIAEVGDAINLEHPNSKNRRGRVECEVAQTLTTSYNQDILEKSYRVRKLTPLECWRLMGMSDERFYRVKTMGVSDSQMYKLAGNSIVKNCLDNIFIELFKEYIEKNNNENYTCSQEN